MTNSSFVEAKQEERCVAVRQLWSTLAGRFGSIAAGHRQRELSLGQHKAYLRRWQQSNRCLA